MLPAALIKNAPPNFMLGARSKKNLLSTQRQKREKILDVLWFVYDAVPGSTTFCLKALSAKLVLLVRKKANCLNYTIQSTSRHLLRNVFCC
jgi:hypothetical protein